MTYLFSNTTTTPETKENSWYRRTFTQRHQKTLRAVKSRLLRKGVLLMAEDARAANTNSRMERWRFYFPQEFHKFLPTPFADRKLSDALTLTWSKRHQSLAAEALKTIRQSYRVKIRDMA